MSLPSSANLQNYPFPANARQYDFEFIRMMMQALMGQTSSSYEGIAGASTDFAMTPTTGLSMSVAAGRAFVKGDDRTTQGSYFVYSDVAKVRTATAANATNPRVDRVVLRVYDADVSGAATQWDVEILAGTPTAGATLTNLNGAAAVPNGCLLLYNLLVPAAFAGPFVAGTHFQDRRYNLPIAGRQLFGAYSSVGNTAAAGQRDLTSMTCIGDGTTPVSLTYGGIALTASVANAIVIAALADGAGLTGSLYDTVNQNSIVAGITGADCRGIVTAAAFAGSKTFYVNSRSANSGGSNNFTSGGAYVRARWDAGGTTGAG